ncbi:Imm1 family immunity protein [Saccharothrix lopnurensis]|uniref:Imm1 family immunity protein n=1 Tax=Saccharothrix lopnurensis TaxID=1670621 RepID=A0ABW1PH46_9PSEU
MATLRAIYDPESGNNPVRIDTQDELDEFVDRVHAYGADHDHPPVVEFTVEHDPWTSPVLYAGIGRDHGFVQELPPGGVARATAGNPQATGTATYDLQGHEHPVPTEQEVPLSTIRVALSAYLAGNGVIPSDQPELRPLDHPQP